MKAYSKEDNPAFRKTFFRDLKIMLGVIFVTAMGIGLTLYAVAKGLID